MKQRTQTPTLARTLSSALLALAALCLLTAPALAQSTSGGTEIKNKASASYSDGTNSYSVTSNEVTVTVANVSGLAVTPDGGSVSNVVAGQSGIDFTFTVTNSGNYATQVRFLANGASFSKSGPAAYAQAVIDTDGNGIDAGDTDILANGADVLSASLARNASLTVIVRLNVNAAANPGDAISVTLGDASSGGPSFDNQAADNSAGELRTSVPSGTTAPVNGESEARGSISTSVEQDARLQVALTVPAGPVALGSNITYSTAVANNGARPASAQTINLVGGGTASGVFVVVPVPARTALQSVPAPGAGVTVYYSTSALGADPVVGADPPASGPLSAAVTWTTTPPAVLSSTTRVGFIVNNGNPLTNGASVSGLDIVLTVQTGINATEPLYGVAEAFARNTVNAPVTDQADHPSAQVANRGDGNANFDEPRYGTSDPADPLAGLRLPTLLTQVGDVLLGPSGAPAAVGPGGDNNLDYTNKSVAPAAIAGLSHEDSLSGQVSVDFVNTVQNTGNADDTFTLNAPTVPLGFSALISTDGGTNFVPASSNPTLAVAFGATANFIVRVTTSANAPVLQGFSVTVRAASANTPAETNDTINRVYTGFLKLEKTATVENNTTTGNGQDDPGADDAVPGADIVYVITYTNVSVGGGGPGCVDLTASSVVINERGDVLPNNWGSNTTQVTAPMPADANSTGTPGTVTDETTGLPVTAATVRLRDSVPNLGPGATGTFTFRRRIN